MDQPSAKKRRKLAPKGAEPTAHNASTAPYSNDAAQQSQPPQPAQAYPAAAPSEATPVSAYPERQEFESFARHLQDAAMLIQRQTEQPPYTSVSVLLLRWEDDPTVEPDLVALEQMLRDRYYYRTEKWNIPSVPNPAGKVGMQMTSFLEHARPNHLLIIYYAGYGYVGPDNQLYWACNAREDAAKLKWDSVRYLFEDAQPDILLLLDTCAMRDAPAAGCHGIKQGIAACGPESNPKESGGRSFTSNLIEALHRLSTGRPFSVQRLFEDIYSQKQQELTQSRALTNGAAKCPVPQLPLFFTLTPGKGQSLSLSPLPTSRASGQDPKIDPELMVDLRFDEQRVLVCTTFVGEASSDMSSFHQWLQQTPALAAKTTVEGLFLGPPTMLLISMPHTLWNIVQHDKVCCFLGYISSHNMISLYQTLVGAGGLPKATSKELEDGRILLEARELAAKTPAMLRRELDTKDGIYKDAAAANAYPAAANASGIDGKEDVEDSAEIQEAAEHLKALSHMRHLSDETAHHPPVERRRTGLPDGIPERREHSSSLDPLDESGVDDTMHMTDLSMASARSQRTTAATATAMAAAAAAAAARRSIQKQPPKQETRCTLCSHTPFKDSSSLRKHIAAAHTRPFPCAFSFAGCASTFGSKNEWKRHIASQHLCLQYYRCSACPMSAVEGKGNEFNRKDLFTQHLRRMHAPFAIKKALSKQDAKMQAEWEVHVKEMQVSCLVTRRKPPQRSACPKPDCQSVFEGPGSWDEWTEHVGRHMEKGEATRMGVDPLLARWALDEGIIEPRGEEGEFRLVAGSGMGGGEMGREVSGLGMELERKRGVEEEDDGGGGEERMEVD